MAKKKVKKGPPRKRPVAKGRTSGKKLDVYQRVAVQQQQMARRSGGDFWNPPKGRSTIRIIPFLHGEEEHVFAEDLRHWNLDPNNRSANVQCIGEDCPICTLVGEMTNEKRQKDLRRRRKILANAVVRKCPDHDDKDAQVLAQLPVTAYNEIAAYIGGDKMQQCPNALDPKKGRDFKISRSGEGFKTKYTVVPLTAKSPVGIDVEPIDLIDRKEANMKSEEEIQTTADELEKLS
jgi:hypothetical protein